MSLRRPLAAALVPLLLAGCSYQHYQSDFGGGPMCVTVTGKSCTETGSMAQAAKIAVSFGPIARSVLSPRAAATAVKKRVARSNVVCPVATDEYQ